METFEIKTHKDKTICTATNCPNCSIKLKTYKSIMLPAKLQEKVKLLATKRKQTIISFIEELLKVL